MNHFTQCRTEYADTLNRIAMDLRGAHRQLTAGALPDSRMRALDTLSQCRADLLEVSECVRTSRRLPGNEEGPHPATSATPDRLAS